MFEFDIEVITRELDGLTYREKMERLENFHYKLFASLNRILEVRRELEDCGFIILLSYN